MKYFTVCLPTLFGGKQFFLISANSLEEAKKQIIVLPEEEGNWDFSEDISEHKK